MSPTFSSSVSRERPVGLMRSPMMRERMVVADAHLAAGTGQDGRGDLGHCAAPTSFFAISTASGALFA